MARFAALPASSIVWRMLCALVAMAAALAQPALAAEPAKPVDFAHDVVPILRKHCAECHTAGKYKGSLSLDTREELVKSEAIVPGKSADSPLIDRIISDDPDEQMPPKGERLSAAEIATLRAWIDQDAPWEQGFTFNETTYVPPLRPRRPELPPASAGLEHPIDRILAAYYAEHDVTPTEPLDDRAFIRRTYLDLVGLLPPPDEVEAFVADTKADKDQRLVRRLLDDRRAYSDHWLTFWNDLLRNDYKGTGYIDGGRKQITVWLYQSLVDNKPFDQFVRELISPSEDSAGFINGIKWRGRVNSSQTPEIQFSQNISQVFFGINMKCASCHDSFIDRWKLDEAYGLAAIVAEEPLEIYRCDKETGRMAQASFLWPELGQVDASAPREDRLNQLAALVTDRENGRFARTISNRIWQRLIGRGIVHPVDVMANPPWSADLLDYLGTYLVDQNYDLKKLMEHIATSRVYRSQTALLESEDEAGDFVFRGPQIKRLTAEQYIDGVWTLTGHQPSEANVKLDKPDLSPAADRVRIRAVMVIADLLMRSLGRPNREQVVTTRGDQLTTMQALDLMNGEILDSTLSKGAEQLLSDHPEISTNQIIDKFYTEALARPPSDAERDTACEVLGEQPSAESLEDFLWMVVMLPEFQLIR